MKLKVWMIPVLSITILTLGVLMLAYPASSWESGVRGLAIWWDVLFPSLFPFFVLSEVMLGFGIVHFLGTLLDPLMRPLFRIPGSGGFVAAMGFASGYPVSAKLATKLRQQGLLTRVEGERLVAFTTSSDPIFLIGAVSVGFFGHPKLAGILALSHYGSALILGCMMRFYGTKNPQQQLQSSDRPSSTTLQQRFSVRKALHAMHEARMQDGRGLGQLLQQAVTSSLQLMTVVGGLVVFFSVVLEVLTVSGIMTSLYYFAQSLLPYIGMPSALAEPLLGGLFEVTLGAKAAATAGNVPLMYKAAAATFILSWGGLSVHAQVASILNGADLRYFPFMISRLLHAIMAVLLLLCLWHPIMGDTSVILSVPLRADMFTAQGWNGIYSDFALFGKIVLILLGLSLIWSFIHRVVSSSRTGGKTGK